MHPVETSVEITKMSIHFYHTGLYKYTKETIQAQRRPNVLDNIIYRTLKVQRLNRMMQFVFLATLQNEFVFPCIL